MNDNVPVWDYKFAVEYNIYLSMIEIWHKTDKEYYITKETQKSRKGWYHILFEHKDS